MSLIFIRKLQSNNCLKIRIAIRQLTCTAPAPTIQKYRLFFINNNLHEFARPISQFAPHQCRN